MLSFYSKKMKGVPSVGNSMALQQLEIHCVRLKTIFRKQSYLRKKASTREEGILEYHFFS